MEDLAIRHVEFFGLISVFALMAANGFASTPPSEIVYGLAGVLVATGKLDMTEVLAAGVTGNVAGTTALYAVGRTVGYRWLVRFRERSSGARGVIRWLGDRLPEAGFYEYLKAFLAARGRVYVGILRCFPIIRSIISLPAGMLRMPLLRFVLYTTVGCSLWAILWVQIGYNLGESWRAWSKWITLLLIVLLVLLLWILKARMKAYYRETYEPIGSVGSPTNDSS